MKVWNSTEHTAAQALDLPKGNLMANLFGMNVEQDVDPDKVLEAAQALCSSGLNVTAGTQAKIMVTAQKKDLAFQDWVGRLGIF